MDDIALPVLDAMEVLQEEKTRMEKKERMKVEAEHRRLSNL